MAQAVSCRPFTAEARIRARVSTCERHWDRFFSKSFGFPLPVSSHHGSLYSYITWGLKNGAVGGRSS
jgi:hypothetical protein